MPQEVRTMVLVLCNGIFCQKLPLPTEVVIMDEGDVRLEWNIGQAAPADALIQVYRSQYIIIVEEGKIQHKEESSEVCALLNAHFAGKFDPSSYDSRDAEIERINGNSMQ